MKNLLWFMLFLAFQVHATIFEVVGQTEIELGEYAGPECSGVTFTGIPLAVNILGGGKEIRFGTAGTAATASSCTENTNISATHVLRARIRLAPEAGQSIGDPVIVSIEPSSLRYTLLNSTGFPGLRGISYTVTRFSVGDYVQELARQFENLNDNGQDVPFNFESTNSVIADPPVTEPYEMEMAVGDELAVELWMLHSLEVPGVTGASARFQTTLEYVLTLIELAE